MKREENEARKNIKLATYNLQGVYEEGTIKNLTKET